MCWNASVSLNTFLLSTFSVLLALMNNIIEPIRALFYMSFFIIQFMEFLIWKQMFSNKLLSIITFIIIFLQPIFSLILINDKNLLFLLLILYLLFIIILLIIKPLNKIDFRSIKAKNGHLAWKWLNFPIYIIIIWALFFLIRFIIEKNYIGIIFIISTIVLSYITYYKYETWGSIWCWVANIIALFLIYKVFKKEICYIYKI